jgi:hypothetical protein
MRSSQVVLALAFCPFLLTCRAQDVSRSELAQILNFELQAVERTGGAPLGWKGGPPGTIFADDKTVHSGKWSARLDRDSSSSGQFSTITIGIPVDFTGRRIELRRPTGFLLGADGNSLVFRVQHRGNIDGVHTLWVKAN